MSDDLFAAIAAGDTGVVRRLIAADAALVHAHNADGVPAIVWAGFVGKPELAELLAGQANVLDLAEAAALGRTDRVGELLDAGEPIDQRTGDGFTPLHYAAFFGHSALARLLVDRGAPLDAVTTNDMQVTALHSAAAGRHSEIALLLVEAGADVRATQRHGWTALHAAAQNGDAELTAALLARSADPQARADDGTTPGELAAAGGFVDLARLLRGESSHEG